MDAEEQRQTENHHCQAHRSPSRAATPWLANLAHALRRAYAAKVIDFDRIRTLGDRAWHAITLQAA
jgi:hypothetical protein